ncbi:MAG TPA: GntG family PLP-dependent aldolase [Phycisphaerales bacterium]|nr:GntG family PLP-dependent aldolase [Phycisphaerales bacterium]
MLDLRSDTVTRPTPQMRQAMAGAEVGDDVLGDDPTVIALQERVAEVLGKEAAVFVPSGTMANQVSIRTHTEPGDEVICHRDSHIIHYETGAPAALSSVMIAPLSGDGGRFSPADIAAVVRARSSHFACSKLLVIENTFNRNGGAVWPLEQVAAATAEARRHGLACHLDGARLWNACVATGRSPRDFAQHFDTVSCCFSKGLGAPVGSAIAGTKAMMTRAHRFRKMFGGAMRQAGMIAAAARFALDNHRDRLQEDHAAARFLADALTVIPGVSLLYPVETNMVFIQWSGGPDSATLSARLRGHGVLTLPGQGRTMRLVTHLDAPRTLIETGLPAFREALRA